VAADIVKLIAINLTFVSLGLLAGLVGVRTLPEFDARAGDRWPLALAAWNFNVETRHCGAARIQNHSGRNRWMPDRRAACSVRNDRGIQR
jgi:hypothetical protein